MAVLKSSPELCAFAWLGGDHQLATTTFCCCLEERNPKPNMARRPSREEWITYPAKLFLTHSSTVILKGDRERIITGPFFDTQFDVSCAGFDRVHHHIQNMETQFTHSKEATPAVLLVRSTRTTDAHLEQPA